MSSMYYLARPICRMSLRSRGYATRSLPATIRQILASPEEQNQPLIVHGWIRSIRKMKNVAFLDLKDGTSEAVLPVVLKPSQITADMTTGSCIAIEGQLAAKKTAKNMATKTQYEIQAQSARVLGGVTDQYPLQKKFATQEYLRSYPTLRWRTAVNASVLRYRSYAQSRLAQFFQGLDFTQTHPPLITSSDCEGAGEVFQISGGKLGTRFFGDHNAGAYLTVSTQLHLEALAGALSRVWTMTPAFRAEPSDTPRHLSEFWMVEAEMAFIDDLDQLMDVAEGMVRSAVGELADENSRVRRDLLAARRTDQDKQELIDRWDALNQPEWTRLTYTECVDLIQRHQDATDQFQAGVTWGEGLRTEHEKWLAGDLYKGPVFVTDYPSSEKPFYMKKNEIHATQQTVACFDLLLPHLGELIGGSMREDDFNKLSESIDTKGIDQSTLKWYIDLRQEGSFPHGGYGMGFERLISYVTGLDNLRDVSAFPRVLGSCLC
ncbi:asparaginyl-tRNA synthetase [Nadsonia fulvescens var. elongata DSM 6958]|uniref:asparagine--tRNA ligase n=1 Tax=Nadsonia fulvescens var. elongata DSM 6958 TaxID=857566 RepID=A0A1E3PEG7_9ASCO|nr:asparaginyl-tRNA synthetase [Nadsonia fulvescens var. elongata DSM 6958]